MIHTAALYLKIMVLEVDNILIYVGGILVSLIGLLVNYLILWERNFIVLRVFLIGLGFFVGGAIFFGVSLISSSNLILKILYSSLITLPINFIFSFMMSKQMVSIQKGKEIFPMNYPLKYRVFFIIIILAIIYSLKGLMKFYVNT